MTVEMSARYLLLLLFILFSKKVLPQVQIGAEFFRNNEFRMIIDSGKQLAQPQNIISPSVFPSIIFRLKNKIAMQVGLHVKPEPVAISFKDQSISGNSVNHSIIEIPIYIIRNYEHNRKWVFQPCIGLKTGYVLNPGAPTSIGKAPYFFYSEYQNLSRFVYSLSFSLRESVTIWKQLSASVSFSYNYGCNIISRTRVDYLFNSQTYTGYFYNRNRYLQIGIGLQYKIHRGS